MNKQHIIAVAKAVQGTDVIGLALLNLETQGFNIVSMKDIPPHILTKEMKASIPHLPTWGLCDNKIMLVGKDGAHYRVYYNGQILHQSIDQILALHNRGFVFVNFMVVRPSNAKAYLKLTRGSLYDYSESSKLIASKVEAPVYVVKVDAVIDDETCDSFYYYHSPEKAKARYHQEVADAKHTAEQEGWLTETNHCGFFAYEDGAYSVNHIDVSLEQIKFSDDEN